jgi:hypothetical protein
MHAVHTTTLVRHCRVTLTGVKRSSEYYGQQAQVVALDGNGSADLHVPKLSALQRCWRTRRIRNDMLAVLHCSAPSVSFATQSFLKQNV